MTTQLQHAIDRLRQLTPERQDSLAALLIAEIDGDDAWATTTERHVESLQAIVDDVLAADARGECQTLEPDQL